MDSEKIICNCQGVTCGQIKKAVDAGATTLAEVQTATGAGTVCGVCLDEVASLVERFVAERDGRQSD